MFPPHHQLDASDVVYAPINPPKFDVHAEYHHYQQDTTHYHQQYAEYPPQLHVNTDLPTAHGQLSVSSSTPPPSSQDSQYAYELSYTDQWGHQDVTHQQQQQQSEPSDSHWQQAHDSNVTASHYYADNYTHADPHFASHALESASTAHPQPAHLQFSHQHVEDHYREEPYEHQAQAVDQYEYAQEGYSQPAEPYEYHNWGHTQEQYVSAEYPPPQLELSEDARTQSQYEYPPSQPESLEHERTHSQYPPPRLESPTQDPPESLEHERTHSQYVPTPVEDERPMHSLEPPPNYHVERSSQVVEQRTQVVEQRSHSVEHSSTQQYWRAHEAPQPQRSPVSPPQTSPLVPAPIALPHTHPQVRTPPRNLIPPPSSPPLAPLAPTARPPSPIPRLSQRRSRSRSRSNPHSSHSHSSSRSRSRSPLPHAPIVPSQSHLAPRVPFRPFHPYPPQHRGGGVTPAPIFGLFGSYPLSRGPRELPLPGPTCAPATSSSVMRLILTPPFKHPPAQPQLPPATPLPPTKRPRMACYFCRKRKIACGPGPAAVKTNNGGKDANAFEDDGPCNQCARRGLTCERPTESKRGVRKNKGKDRDEDGAAASGSGVTLELSPRSRVPTRDQAAQDYEEYDDDDDEDDEYDDSAPPV